jgi:phosphate:Na+ symporter
MGIMTEGLREAAGERLRAVLGRATRSRLAGIGLGTALGTLVQSSAATVMLVGFINAGLMTLEQSIPPMLGADIGTTLSMQFVSFRLGDYCFVAIAVGLIVSVTAPGRVARACGRGLLGFGLLFLGMNVMSDAIRPHRAALAPFLQTIRGDSLAGTLRGLLISAALTGIWQSSGATVGICFALISAGVFTELHQVFPIVMGARIGTCATALLGSIGTNVEARRSAVAHLAFNILNAGAAVALRPLLLRVVPLSSPDLIRQTANLHTLTMLIGALPLLPFARGYAALMRLLVPSRRPLPEPSHLDPELLRYPEQALAAALREIQRIARLCARSFHLAAHVLLFDFSRLTLRRIKLNETVVDDIKQAMRDYLGALTRHYLSRRQMILIQHLDRCITDIERIGDHIEAIADISLKRRRNPAALVDEGSIARLLNLYKSAEHILQLVIESLDPDLKDFRAAGQAILAARDGYVAASMAAKNTFADAISSHSIPALAAMFYAEYVSSLDRIVRHAKLIALAQKHPDFWIKRSKLERPATPAEDVAPPPLVAPADFLDKLELDDYL